MREQSSGIWTDALDSALRSAAAEALADGCVLLLFLHTWVLTDFASNQSVVKGADKLRQTLANHPSLVAAFTGHRHINRITAHRDYLIVDTACLIGFPLGYREIILSEDGYFTTRFHTLDLPQLNQDSYDRSTAEENRIWQGHVHDRDTEIFLPRLKEVWG